MTVLRLRIVNDLLPYRRLGRLRERYLYRAGVIWLVSPSLLTVDLSTNNSLSIACSLFL